MNKKEIKIKKDAAVQRKKKIFILFTAYIPALLHSFYINRR